MDVRLLLTLADGALAARRPFPVWVMLADITSSPSPDARRPLASLERWSPTRSVRRALVHLSVLTQRLAGRVLLLGTPAEEGGGGKVVMLEHGAYDSMAACLMLHPSSSGTGASIDSTNAKRLIEVEYFGEPAHAAGNPGPCALPSYVLSLTPISCRKECARCRQHCLRA